jgi:SAM-dependent methyltransferase
VDVNADLLRWPGEHYAQPGLTFTHIDAANSVYNPHGSTPAAQARLPFADGSFDVIVAFSLFTHLLRDAAERYLNEISRLLRPDGRLLATWFLLTDERERCIKRGKTSQILRHRWPTGLRVADPRRPEAAVGYPETVVQQLVSTAGLKIVQVHRGSWCCDELFVSDYQDQIVVGCG